MSAADWWLACLEEYPIRTNAVVAGVLCSLGDVLAQVSEWKLDIMSPNKEEFNWQRTLRMGFWGTAICGPVLSMWYRTLHLLGEAVSVSYAPVVSGRAAWLLERAPALQWLTDLHKPTVQPWSPMQLLLGKVAVDTMIFQAPFLNLYFAVTGALEGLSFAEIVEKTRASFHRAWFLSLMVWTPVQLVNLHLVPLPLQPVAVASVNVGFQTTLSILNHYHDHGSPRTAPLADSSQPPLPSRYSAADRQGDASSPSAAADARPSSSAAVPPPQLTQRPPPYGWEAERTQLRARIAQLLAENKSLRLQLGQVALQSSGADGARSVGTSKAMRYGERLGEEEGGSATRR